MLSDPTLLSSASAPASPRPNRPRVLILTTGGTIQGSAATRDGHGLADYRIGDTPASTMLAAIPELDSLATLQVESICNLDSGEIDLPILSTLTERIRSAFTDPAPPAGVVITHGTDTLEETAYFLNLVVGTDYPVVVTGSMRPSTALSADGPINLLDAVRVATNPNSRNRGVLVVLNGQIHAARDVMKTSARGVHTFHSPDTGPLGVADPDAIRYYRSSDQRHGSRTLFARMDVHSLPKVQIIAAYQEAGREDFDAALAANAPGVVLSGPLTSPLKSAIRDATRRGMTVVL